MLNPILLLLAIVLYIKVFIHSHQRASIKKSENKNSTIHTNKREFAFEKS